MVSLKTFRVAFRFAHLGISFLFAFLDFFFRLWLTGRSKSIAARAQWMQCWATRFLRVLHVEVESHGPIPQRGVLVSNHLSYLDIVVLGSLRPLVFVSKSEVASWPVVGALTRCAGTLYIVRQQKGDVVRLGEEMVAVVEAGVPLTLFLEGTSSDGHEVLPFRSSLLAPVEDRHWPATGAWLHYQLAEGSVADEVCYWRDMTFFPHLLNLMAKPRINAIVCFGPALTEARDRKQMARELHAQVCGLKSEWERSAAK